MQYPKLVESVIDAGDRGGRWNLLRFKQQFYIVIRGRKLLDAHDWIALCRCFGKQYTKTNETRRTRRTEGFNSIPRHVDDRNPTASRRFFFLVEDLRPLLRGAKHKNWLIFTQKSKQLPLVWYILRLAGGEVHPPVVQSPEYGPWSAGLCCDFAAAPVCWSWPLHLRWVSRVCKAWVKSASGRRPVDLETTIYSYVVGLDLSVAGAPKPYFSSHTGLLCAWLIEKSTYKDLFLVAFYYPSGHRF